MGLHLSRRGRAAYNRLFAIYRLLITDRLAQVIEITVITYHRYFVKMKLRRGFITIALIVIPLSFEGGLWDLISQECSIHAGFRLD